MTLGKNIQKYRKEARLTQVALAKKLGLEQTHISRWELDKMIPSIESLKKIAQALNTSVDDLLLTEKEKKNLQIGDKKLLEKLNEIDQLSPEDRTMIVRLIDTLKSKCNNN